MRILPTAFLLAVLTPVSAMAAPIVYTDREAFNAAVGDHTLLTFDTFVPLQRSALM
jgi:hypothetical protein